MLAVARSSAQQGCTLLQKYTACDWDIREAAGRDIEQLTFQCGMHKGSKKACRRVMPSIVHTFTNAAGGGARSGTGRGATTAAGLAELPLLAGAVAGFDGMTLAALMLSRVPCLLSGPPAGRGNCDGRFPSTPD